MSTDKIGSPNLLAEMNAGQLSEQQITPDKTIAVLIFGACENHGNHLPFGADFIMPFELAKRVAMKHKNILVLPALPYGVSSHHKDFAMTMSLQPETMIAIIFDLMESLVQNKVRRILVINGHDGNIAPIELASRKIKEKYSKVVISCMESWWTLIGQLDKDLFEVWNGMGHGGEAETSAMLAVRPDLVEMSLAPEQVVPKLPSGTDGNDQASAVRIYWRFNELTNTGATGAPRAATAEKGDKIIHLLENVLISFINEMDRTDWKYGQDSPRSDIV